jgi:ATP-dependent Lon protease
MPEQPQLKFADVVSALPWPVRKQAQRILMLITARRQLNDLHDESWTKISSEFYKDATNAVFKSLVE